jgi:hypothetical protein
MASKARKSFDANIKDIDRLLEIHTNEGGTSKGRRYNLDVLNKSAIVLITAYWEAYCEDIAAEGLKHLIQHLNSSEKLPKEIKKQIASSLKNEKNDLAIWKLSGDGWKSELNQKFQTLENERNRKLNTPKSGNIDELFLSTVGISKISKAWKYKNLSNEDTRNKLDEYITLRGEIAHRGKPTTSVQKKAVMDYLDFVKKLASTTGGEVNKHVRQITGTPLWQKWPPQSSVKK